MKTFSIFLITVALIAGMVCYVARPIEIRDWYDLNAIRDNLDDSYLLMNDLDSTTPGYEELAGETANQGKGWQPIGTFVAGHHGLKSFEGTFDGQGYEIRDLFINRADESAVGLFRGVEQEGVIKDIGVVNATVTGSGFTGTLVGLNHGAVRDSYFTGNMTGVDWVGGLVGLNDGTVSNSHSRGSVTGNGNVGGLMGRNFGTVSNSHSTGSVTGNYSVGGLVGANDGTVSNSHSSTNVTGTSTIGGLVGGAGGTVSSCYATGNATGEEFIGGLLGLSVGTVNNTYSTGSVTGNSSVGGLVGDAFDGTVNNTYSTGSVTGNSSVGGLVGENERSTVTNSFWDTQTSGQATSAGGTGKTTAEMECIDTFSGAAWNIIAVAMNQTTPAYIWNIVDDVTYPFLSWQSTT